MDDVLYVAFCGDRPLAGAVALALRAGTAVRIGRGAALTLNDDGDELELTLPDDRVSGQHAVIERRGDAHVVVDLGSTNGTFLNGQKIQEAVLTPSARLVVGRTLLWLATGVSNAILGAPRLAGDHPLLSTLNPALSAVHDVLVKAARAHVPIVLQGETGTGKEVAARAVHELSGRGGAFVAVNCGAIPEALIEGELFGWRKGAFSGATADRVGWLRAADGGTLFLDEIGDLPASAQVKLLRVLQERTVTPLGSSTAERCDFRLVSATHRDLPAMVERGGFRMDLWARVKGPILQLPALRDRREDLGQLIAASLRRHAGERAASYRFDRKVVDALAAAAWPYNIRELDRAIESMLALAAGQEIGPAVLAAVPLAETQDPGTRRAEAPSDDELRRELVEQLTRHEGNVSAVARAMGRTRMQIHRWLKRWSLRLEDFRATR